MDLPDHFVWPRRRSRMKPAPNAMEIPIRRYLKIWSSFYCGTNFFINLIS